MTKTLQASIDASFHELVVALSAAAIRAVDVVDYARQRVGTAPLLGRFSCTKDFPILCET